MNLFPRFMRLEVDDGTGWTSDLTGLSTKFAIERVSQGGTGYATISVNNLSSTTIARISKPGAKVRLTAGYPQRFGTLFDGTIANVVEFRDGANRRTDIFGAESILDMSDAHVEISFSAPVTLHRVLTTIVSTFSGIRISPDSLRLVPDRTLPGNWVADGGTREEINRLAAAFGFKWHIQGSLFLAQDIALSSTARIIISRDSGMIGSPVVSAGQVEVRTLLDHRIFPLRVIDVRTAAAEVGEGARTLQEAEQFLRNARINQRGGLFRVLRVIHTGESRGQTWYTQAVGTPLVTPRVAA